ncbi:pirin family protein [Thiobacillus denitrificans]|uniref:Quercetin 2,3-dioxygenase n=1 Tax=Thiobacillus denitrificans TaxID=36861 RepID=A0A125BD04_THIDE|nr:pirin family protein [Thiobacillus denitrificans]KVW97142.1 quercetin 2,3-dioxygenase [Thiobacillus denitrificans]
MLIVRKSAERGHAHHGWLDSFHSFSFASYHDPAWLGFGPLRVINEDRISPGGGFPTHSHQDMEIVTWVLAGALEHQDSLGNGGVIRPGEVQRMRAGHGIAHSEFNASATEPVHLLQIWIEPDAYGLEPGYEQIAFAPDSLQGRLQLIASRDGRDGSVTIHQDAAIHAGRLAAGDRATLTLAPGRRAWLQVATGRVKVQRLPLDAGDAVAVRFESAVDIEALEASEVICFDLP